jgi:hypothetical protein
MEKSDNDDESVFNIIKDTDFRLEVNNKEKDRIVKSCCFELNGTYITWGAQFLISVGILTFSCVQLALIPSAAISSSSIYTALVSGILSYWLPNPSLPKR